MNFLPFVTHHFQTQKCFAAKEKPSYSHKPKTLKKEELLEMC